MRKLSTAVALLAMLFVLCSWLRGSRRADGVALVTPAGNVQAIGHHRGRLMVFTSAIAVRSPGQRSARWVSTPVGVIDAAITGLEAGGNVKVKRLGFQYMTGDGAVGAFLPSGPRRLVILPPWVICLAAGVVLVAPTFRRREPAGHCRTCGYDLRGSRERCPECGTTFDDGNSLASVAAGS